MDRYLRVENVGMTFETKKGNFVALERIDLTIRKGEFVSLIGHSGCGKSTLLNMVAGLLQPTEGGILLAEREIGGPGPDRGVVFQNHSLLPWLTCFDNVYLAVERVFPEKKAALKQRTHKALAMVGSDAGGIEVPAGDLRRHEAARRHRARAGDRAQGAAAGRAVRRAGRAHARQPAGRTDAHRGEHAATVLMVTHDVDEAVLLSDRIVMMTNGPAARIGGIVDVDLPRPRERLELAGSHRYMELRTTVMDFLYRKQLKQAA